MRKVGWSVVVVVETKRISQERFDLESSRFTQTAVTAFSKHTGNGATSYFRSVGSYRKKTSRNVVSDDLEANGSGTLNAGSRNCTAFSKRTCLTNVLDITLVAAHGRLQNAIEYCIKVRTTNPVGKESSNNYCSSTCLQIFSS